MGLSFLVCHLSCGIALTSCSEKDELMDEPAWLGNSIYERLQEDGKYGYTLRLIDDLGQKDVLSKTGSKTLFVAQDETYEQFFRQNTWGVHRYEDLTAAQKKPYKAKQKSGVNKKTAFSIFTNDLNRCFITGSKHDVHIHHVFGASNKKNSEIYGFIIPLDAEYHDMSDKGIHFDKEFDLKIKRQCQENWLENIGSKEEFIKKFGKWW